MSRRGTGEGAHTDYACTRVLPRETGGGGGNTPNTRYAAFCKVTGKVYAQEPRATYTPRRERQRVMEKQKEKKKNGAHCSYLGGCYSGGKHATRGSELDGPG